MRRERKIAFAAMTILVVGVASFTAGRSQGSPRPESEPSARCTIVVPRHWGDYVGAGSYGLEFKDESGTLRFVKEFPCGGEGAPNVSLEVHRK